MFSGSKQTQRAFSLVELLVCIAIIAVIAALTFPIAKAAKVRSYDAVCTTNLRSLWFATSLYREEQGSSVDSGSMYAMGLPTHDWFVNMQLTKRLSCPLQTKEFHPLNGYQYLAGDPASPQMNDYWVSTTKKFERETMLIVDFLHGDTSTLRLSTYPHVGIGVNLGGGLRRKKQSGSLITPYDVAAWWGSGNN